MAKNAALVLSSGGLHSLVTAGLASREYRVGLLHLADGRTSAKAAGAAFIRQVDHFKPAKHRVIDATYMRQMTLPPETAGLVSTTGSDAQASLIPLRELQLLSVAAGFARQIHAPVIFWGVQFEARASEAIARNVELVQIFNQLIDLLSPESPIILKTPLMGLDDQQVIELGYQMGLPFAASWTCQLAVMSAAPNNNAIETPCMSCSACARRIRAFRAAQLADPLVARK